MRYPDPLPDYYATLSVRRDASQGEIVAAYRREIRLCHPDLHPEGGACETRAREVNEAYEVLGEVTRRREYDRELARRERLLRGVPTASPESAWLEWLVRRAYASPRRRPASPLGDLFSLLDALFDAEDVWWERSVVWQIARMLARNRQGTWRSFDVF